jgi:hypothetical protein
MKLIFNASKGNFMKSLLVVALLFSFSSAFATDPAAPETKKMTRKEAKAKCRDANPGIKGKALRECVKKELHK